MKTRQNMIMILLMIILAFQLLPIYRLIGSFTEYVYLIIYVIYVLLFVFIIQDYKNRIIQLLILSIVVIMEVIVRLSISESYIIMRLLGYYILIGQIVILYIEYKKVQKERTKERSSFMKMVQTMSYLMFWTMLIYMSMGFIYLVEFGNYNNFLLNIFYHFVETLNAYRSISYEVWRLVIYGGLVLVTFMTIIMVYILNQNMQITRKENKLQRDVIGYSYTGFLIFMIVFFVVTRAISSYSGECYKVSIIFPLITSVLLIGTLIFALYVNRYHKEDILESLPFVILIGLIISGYLVYVQTYNHRFNGDIYGYVLGLLYVISIITIIVIKVRQKEYSIHPILLLGYIYMGYVYITLFQLITENYYITCT